MRKPFYGWIIAAASGLGIGCGVSVFIPSTLGLLIGPLGREMGWTPQALFLCPLFAAIATIFVATPIGAMVDKYGVRPTIAFGFLAQTAITASFYFLSADIFALYLRYALFAILGTATTAVSFTRLISAWFDRDRGLALGIALAGTGIGGAIWSVLAQYFIVKYGWREAFFWDAGMMVLVLGILLLVIRETPKSMGLNVDGSKNGETRQVATSLSGMTLRDASKTRAYRFMVVGFLIVVSAAYAVMLHLVPMLRQRGVSGQTAAAIQASLWVAVVFGRVVTGWLMDRVFAPFVAAAFLIPSAVGMGMLATGAGGAQAVAAAMMVGAAAGAEIDVMAYLCGRYFGLRHYGKIYGSLFAIAALATAVGPALAAQLLPLLGGYPGVLWFESALMVIGFFMFLQFPRFDCQSSTPPLQTKTG